MNDTSLRCDLEQYRAMRAELDRLKRRYGTVTDTVRGSYDDYPYTEHAMTIRGRPEVHFRDRQRIAALSARCGQVQRILEDIPDNQDRFILASRYLDGLTWEEIGAQIGVSEDAARMRARRYLQKNF